MYTFAQTLSSHSSIVVWLVSTTLTAVVGVLIWVIHHGGQRRFLTWIVDIESSEREDAIKRIKCGINAIQSNGGPSECYDFIAGLDQWRVIEARIARRSSGIRRSGISTALFVLFGVASFIVPVFEPPVHTWSAVCVAAATITFAWLFWNVWPLIHLVCVNGAPDLAKDSAKGAVIAPTQNVATDAPPRGQTGQQ